MITVFIANVLTWYEFSLYIQFATVLGQTFFSHKEPGAALISILIVFAAGFITRPLGTLLLSHIGDRIGRRSALLLSIILMTVPTLGIGIIPSYAAIGITAPLLVAAMRLLQGFATGGEFPGTMVYLYEISPATYRAFSCSLTFCATQFGSIFAIIEFLLLDYFDPETLFTYMWRVSFITGSLFGFIAWLLRRTLHETPLFEMMKTEKKTALRPVIETFTNQKIALIKGISLSALAAGGWYVVFVFSPLYFGRTFELSTFSQLTMNAVLLLLSSLIMPIFGYLADNSYKQLLFITSAICTILLSIPLYFAAINSSFGTFLSLQVAMVILLTVQFALLPVLLCDMFPVRLRYTCVGISYNFSNLVFGGTIPFSFLALTAKPQFFLAPAFILILISILSIWAYGAIKQLNH